MDAKCKNCGHMVRDIDDEFETYHDFELTCDECSWVGYWELSEVEQ